MDKFEIVIPCIFGLEALIAKELKWMGYDTHKVEDGRVTFLGTFEDVAKANLNLRCGERVLIKIGEFTATSFEELFEKTKALDWSRWLSKNSAFPVKGFCLKSTLASMRDCQAIIKKAVVSSLSEKYGIEWFEEDGVSYQIQFSVMKDLVTLMIDTSGDGLHKRGYRRISNAAPLKETIAAAMVMLSFWKYEYPLCDPFCGSGTLPIEAAMFKRNIAPGLMRTFACEGFDQSDPVMWSRLREEAESKRRDTPLTILASDIDPATIEIAKENARIAGLSDVIKPQVADATKFTSDIRYGSIICNPPYGERLSDAKECQKLYQNIGKAFEKLPDWSYYILTSDENFENNFGRKADKRRKIYNGMIKCNIFQYYGARPPKNS
ncbi:MAG: class I SAM-dependent RNA methyltransferase [Clostridia bacterium]|nr:class I SAM-dependent RNA methyltransferase [Clostridia bacterium]